MLQMQTSKKYDLEDRTLKFGKRIIKLAKALIRNPVNWTLTSQVIRSGTSIGANYREANETSTKKDFLFRMRICRKETKETIYWLQLIIEANPEFEKIMQSLLQETNELLRIIASIIVKSQ